VKNVEVQESTRGSYRIRVAGMPPLRGWALKYISGMEEMGDVHSGYWLSRWYADTEAAEFAFEEELHFAFTDQQGAEKVSRFLREGAEISTEVVKVG
jgi:hypothetical protein